MARAVKRHEEGVDDPERAAGQVPACAASQKSCELDRLKPTPGSRTTSADTRNQTMNASVRLAVVMASVRQARVLPVDSQKLASSGVQRPSHVPPACCPSCAVSVVAIGKD